MYGEQRWHDNPVFDAPMFTCANGTQMFAGDLVILTLEDGVLYTKIPKKFKDVSTTMSHSLCTHNHWVHYIHQGFINSGNT